MAVYTTIYIKSSQTAGCSPSWHCPTNKTFSPSLFPGFMLDVWQEWAYICAWWKDMCQKRSDDQRECEGVRQSEKKIFLSSLHVKLKLLLQQTGSQKIYTHKHASNLTCAGSIRHLSDLSQAHSRAHAHTCYYHTLIAHSRWGVQPSSEDVQLLLRNQRYGPLSALFFFLSFLSLYTWKVLFLNAREKRVEYGGASVLMASQNRGWDAGMRSRSFSPGPSMICNKHTCTN